MYANPVNRRGRNIPRHIARALDLGCDEWLFEEFDVPSARAEGFEEFALEIEYREPFVFWPSAGGDAPELDGLDGRDTSCEVSVTSEDWVKRDEEAS